MTRKDVLQYFAAADKLASSVKRDIQKDGCISNKTILALNDFQIAANLIVDSIKAIKDPDNKLN